MPLSPVVSSVPITPNVGLNNSWISVSNDQNRSLFAQATYKVNELGSNGITVIAGTNQVNGNFGGIQTITSTIFAGLTSTGTTAVSAISIPTFPAGFVLNGNFTSIRLTSGQVVAYNA
jgi:hypothetical protein